MHGSGVRWRYLAPCWFYAQAYIRTVPLVRTVQYAEMFWSSQELAPTIGADSGLEASMYAYNAYGMVDIEGEKPWRYDRELSMLCAIRTVSRAQSRVTRGAWRWAGHLEERR